MAPMISIQPHPAATWHEPADLPLADSATPYGLRPVHCAMLAVDIAGFSSRDPGTQQHLHAGLYRIVQDACNTAGVPWRICHHEDRGDGILVIAPAGVSPELLDSIAAHLCAGVRRYNKLANPGAKIRLRMALHAGYVRRDDEGVSGPDVIHLFRLLDAPQLKARLAASHANFALIISDHLYNEVIQHAPSLIEPATYQHIAINNKETHTSAWIWLPSTSPPNGVPAAKAEPPTSPQPR